MAAPPALKSVFPHKYLNQRNQGTVDVYGRDKHTYNDIVKSHNTKKIVIYNV
jgi:hypothetical protein